MLSNPKWGVSLTGLIVWLEGEPPEVTYDYSDARACLGAQFLMRAGVPLTKLPTYSGDLNRFVPGLQSIAVGYPRTFGAALDRARGLRK